MESIEASRQIMWMIPSWMNILMYLSLIVATYFFATGIIAKYKYVTAGGKNIKNLLPKKKNF